MKRRLIVYDDDARFGNRYVEKLRAKAQIQSKFEVELINNTDFIKQLGVIEERRKLSRRKSKVKSALNKSCLFDETDVLIVDMDLIESHNPFLTGEWVSYSVRCYSKCKIIIGLSQYAKLDFDLSLKGQPDSFDDLTISASQVGNSGLWTNEWNDFRPWHWPCIPAFIEAFEKKVDAVAQNTQAPILAFLGMDHILGSLPSSAIEFLGGEAPSKVTFEEFVLKSGKGFRGNDKPMGQDMIARIAVARITKWLERLVLSGQDIFVDAPHLVSRFPSLLSGDSSRKLDWNRTSKFSSPSRLGINHNLIERFRFRKETWISRPVWFWSALSNFQAVREVKYPWEGKQSPFVFCEDASAFFRRGECKEFTASIDSPFARRYVKIFPNLVYAPTTNLLR